MTKKIILKIGILALLAMIILPAGQVVATESAVYKLLAPLPDLDSVPNNVNALKEYIPKIINLLIALSATTAILMIVVGGFQYMSTDAIQGKSAGKERIKNAIWGLVLVLSAYLILWTVNPNLLTLNLNIDAVTTTPVATGGTLGVGGTFDPGIQAQVPDASPDLSRLLGCMFNNLPSGTGRVSSISDSNNRVGTSGFDTCKTCPRGTQLPQCAHTCGSCHYGGSGSNQSYAVDFGDENNITAVGGTVITCASQLGIPLSSITLRNEGDHLHYEVGCQE